MPWQGEKGSSLIDTATRQIPAVRRLARREIQSERQAILAALERATVQDLDDVIEGTLERRAPEWHRFYRRTIATVGADHALDGIPPSEREQRGTIGVSWGDSSDPWWREEFAPLIQELDWYDAWLMQTLRFAEQEGARRVRFINAATRRRLARQVRLALASGEGIDRIIKRVDRLYLDKILPNRSEVIARTETLNAARAGSYNATIASGWSDQVVKDWFTIMDGRQRDSHAQAMADNVEVPFEDPFQVAGSLLRYPGDSSLGAGPAITVQCRCDVIRSVS